AARSPALLADVGWQLSFLGAAGLIWLGPVLERRLAWLPGLARGPLAGTLAAQLFVFPVLASIFGNLSLVSPLANVLAIPLVPWIMLGGALLSGAGALLQPTAPLLASLTWVPVSVLLWVVEWCASLPWAATDLPAIGAGGVALYLALLVAFCGWLEWRAQRAHATPGTLASLDSSDSLTSASAGAELGGASLAGRPVSIRQRAGQVALAALAALACVGLVAARPPGAVPDGFALSLATALPGLIVDAPDVAGGTVLLVQLPDGARVWVNGGPAAGSATTLLGQYLRPWDRTVDVVIAADAREVYLTGLTRVLERYRVGVLVDATGVARSGAARLLRETAKRRGVRRLPAETGTELQLASGLSLQMLSTPTEATSASGVTSTPTSQNVTPLALRVHWGTFGVLVPGDGSAAHVRSLLSGEHDLRSTVLLLTERTARSADGARLIRAADPELVVVQGDQRAPSVTAGAADGAGEHTSSGWSDEDLPTRWHRTATDGPLRLRVSGDGTYVAVGG
ncbi:MAG TPA: ComEC/Rec2 family competence protein, partial [Chloroflexota bacterium]|nr:ComEC/Rec2 family competence protein [Chloroflexota bacterium]